MTQQKPFTIHHADATQLLATLVQTKFETLYVSEMVEAIANSNINTLPAEEKENRTMEVMLQKAIQLHGKKDSEFTKKSDGYGISSSASMALTRMHHRPISIPQTGLQPFFKREDASAYQKNIDIVKNYMTLVEAQQNKVSVTVETLFGKPVHRSEFSPRKKAMRRDFI